MYNIQLYLDKWKAQWVSPSLEELRVEKSMLRSFKSHNHWVFGAWVKMKATWTIRASRKLFSKFYHTEDFPSGIHFLPTPKYSKNTFSSGRPLQWIHTILLWAIYDDYTYLLCGFVLWLPWIPARVWLLSLLQIVDQSFHLAYHDGHLINKNKNSCDHLVYSKIL